MSVAQLSLLAPAPLLRDLPTAVQAAGRASTDERRPRHYQATMVATALEQLRTIRSTLAVMATGTGKTFSAAQIITAWRGRGAVLWLNESDDLVEQMCGELAALTGEEVFREQGPVKAPERARIVVATVQSMSQENRLAGFDRRRFSLIIPDEAHHSVTDSYRRVFGHFSEAKIVGLSATPQRHDGKAMEIVYEDTCIEYLWGSAVRDGYLCGIDWKQGSVAGFDLSRIRKSSSDFTDEQVVSVMNPEVIAGIINATMEAVPNEKGVLYFPRVEIAHAAAMAFNNRVPGSAHAIDGSMDRDTKRAILRAHKRGDFLRLTTCAMIGEGHDDAGISYVGLGRPTKSKSVIVQCCGRPVRPGIPVDCYATAEERRAAIAGSWKPLAKVLNYVSSVGPHVLADPVDCLAGRHDTDKVKAKAREILQEAGGGDVEAALERARRMSDGERREAAAKLARVQAVKWDWRSIDPFVALGMDGPTSTTEFEAGASEKQKAAIARAGIRVSDKLTFSDAQRLVKAIKVRQRKGLADFGLIRVLSKHGIPAQQMYQSTALKLRDLIQRHRGWTPPQDEIRGVIASREAGED